MRKPPCRALVFAAKGDLNEAREELLQAVGLKPDYPEAYHNLGVTLARMKRLDQAGDAFRQAIRLRPDYAEAILNLARACEEKGKADDAVAAYQELSRLRPEDAHVHNSLGLLFAKGAADDRSGRGVSKGRRIGCRPGGFP